MPTALFSIEIVVGVLVALVVLALAATFLRRRFIAHGLPLTVCGLRSSTGGQWRVGHLRFADQVLEFYPIGALSVRPRHRWCRHSLMLEVPKRLAASDAIGALPDAWRVPASQDGVSFELGLQGPAYTALRSWQEASPPGYNVNVA